MLEFDYNTWFCIDKTQNDRVADFQEVDFEKVMQLFVDLGEIKACETLL